MADIVFRYNEMKTASDKIRELAARYKTSADTFESSFLSAIQAWEGDSHDRMQQFISGSVMEYTRTTVPQLINALADLLDANAKQMKDADRQLAESIPTGSQQA